MVYAVNPYKSYRLLIIDAIQKISGGASHRYLFFWKTKYFCKNAALQHSYKNIWFYFSVKRYDFQKICHIVLQIIRGWYKLLIDPSYSPPCGSGIPEMAITSERGKRKLVDLKLPATRTVWWLLMLKGYFVFLKPNK